jgi:hypothetical protein
MENRKAKKRSKKERQATTPTRNARAKKPRKNFIHYSTALAFNLIKTRGQGCPPP